MKIRLTRYESGDHGSFGFLRGPGIRLHVIELPWRDNRSNLSCIPVGEYRCERVRSPRFGVVYHIKDVPGRSHVLIHSGNYAGDSTKGWKTHSHGCILPARKRGRLGKQLAGLCSKSALSSFMSALNRQPFKLIIEDVQ
ncbi:DUF5675 family protein [Maridesulfovibrio sp.]|uniref:DUF5675 family protein n=1 Tax=Maridesulfovibrio sp. TaxID=2795000 RepID=UPI0029CA83E7|nr:DUF5675 family protein [Maridesulfovibrio sp.]